MQQITTTNPFTNEPIETYDLFESTTINRMLMKSEETYSIYRTISLEERSRWMHEVAVILEERKVELATLMMHEMGKLLLDGIKEVEKCSWVCRYYAENASKFLETKEIKTDATKSVLYYDPLGPILAVMPWNYPFWQVFRFAAPALMAGNTCVLKHASNVVGCALVIEDIFKQAGFLEGCFTTLVISSKQVHAVIENPIIRAVSLTGSKEAGSMVASTAGKMIKKSVLELGGNDPYLIFPDADLELAIEKCTTSRLLNTGQSCIGAKRFLVHDAVYDSFLERFRAVFQGIKLGDPSDPNTQCGPMARVDLRDEVHEQVQASIEKGATCSLGGFIPDLVGAFYPPTILEQVSVGMPAYNEEIFGPVASFIRIHSNQDFVRIANDSPLGLGAAIFTNDVEMALNLAHDIQSGACFINDFVRSDPRLPFGGIKESGYGRELGSLGICEFVNIKTVVVG